MLFTSYALLRRTYQGLAQPLSQLGIAALKQGDAPRHRLTGHFQRDKTSVLFATASFWEGVDVAGEALENLVLTKLPFSVPRDPVVAARVEAIRNRNGDPFLEYIVPQAVIRFRQGFGRLIRDRKDRGCILILDRRVLDKSYGRTFLDSLPDCRRVTGKSDLVLQNLRAFSGPGVDFCSSRRGLDSQLRGAAFAPSGSTAGGSSYLTTLLIPSPPTGSTAGEALVLTDSPSRGECLRPATTSLPNARAKVGDVVQLADATARLESPNYPPGEIFQKTSTFPLAALRVR